MTTKASPPSTARTGTRAAATSTRSTRPDTVKQRGYRHRNGLTRSTLVALVDAGEVLETASPEVVKVLTGLLGVDTARAARQAYLRSTTRVA